MDTEMYTEEISDCTRYAAIVCSVYVFPEDTHKNAQNM